MILYLHIPFCTSKCGYCAFNSSNHFFHLQESYLKALCEDIVKELEGKNYTLESIYIGGGTPNTLSSQDYEQIFKKIAQHANFSKTCEITLECNPNLLHQQWCRDLKSMGASRLSIGVQSFFDQKLEFLQREHQGKDIVHSLDLAHSAGFENLSIDLIYGTPLDTKETLQEEIALASLLPINHLSAYSLSIDKGSRFYTSPPSLPLEDMGDLICVELEKKGFIQYEVSNFARNYRCLHNLAYWRASEYIGCGAGAVGFINGVRYTKTRHIPSYIKDPFHKIQEVLSQKEQFLEKLFLGLRSEIGVEVELLQSQKVFNLLSEDKALIENGFLKVKDFFLADEIAIYLS
ncbi:coproporphyrinogen III oxidase family protein [Helicobacter cholecystus]|uniref:Heme chaperone HemW n=1 Tax=Helicobacter cholecystus TaxID=45498 RepID=A0A3D8IVE6_9HELI|nr:radical SAM family heme chaperone HemW [Helicobacter cholecystus]RDU68946.1 coproporphyrinogen III oxidase family protein [Helicobacter cholecystus]VEJ25958.1 putative coproporphyrinogen III oxidase [Helicobacter cholecystus]